MTASELTNSSSSPAPEAASQQPTADRVLTPAAQRALAEAEARRRARVDAERPVEIGGPKGPEPVRYGDWEIKGRASDF